MDPSKRNTKKISAKGLANLKKRDSSHDPKFKFSLKDPPGFNLQNQ